MDLYLPDAEPSQSERTAVDALLGPPTSAWDGGEHWDGDRQFSRGGRTAAHGRRHLLLPALHAVNDRVGWISPGALGYVCQRLSVPPAEAYGVATFYAMFSLQHRPPRTVHVCTDVVCMTRGADALCRTLAAQLGPAGDSLGYEGNGEAGSGYRWQESPCLGRCEQAPVALAMEAGDPPRDAVLPETTAEQIIEVARHGSTDEAKQPLRASVPQQQGSPGPPAPHDDPSLVLLRRVGVVDPASLDDYRATGGFLGLRRAFDIGPAAVIREVSDSGLTGRGGAAFPTGRKWQGTAIQPARPHYLICNGDESEPGTFKDRIIMAGDPYAVVEAMTIAAYACGCERGYLYVRAEYPGPARALRHAIEQCRARGFLGEDILGHGFCFDIEVRLGAGAYIAGEETALFNSIEGGRAEPRNKPPLPIEKGLFGKPTVVNNVETLVNVPVILTDGAVAYSQVGTEKSTGTRLFCLSGAIGVPGLYEVALGTTLRELLDLAGGVPPGRTLQAILLGGAAGGFAGPDDLDVPLTFEDARDAGLTLGSGVVCVLDEQVDIAAILLRIAAFFRDESCGQCVPCRVGTVRQEEALRRLVDGRPLGSVAADLDLLREVGQVMRDASICGLGTTAWNAIESAIDRLGTLKEASS